MERRLDCARRLLAGTGLLTKEIAAMCGFSNQAHLTRPFGAAPSAFRKGDRPAG